MLSVSMVVTERLFDTTTQQKTAGFTTQNGSKVRQHITGMTGQTDRLTISVRMRKPCNVGRPAARRSRARMKAIVL